MKSHSDPKLGGLEAFRLEESQDMRQSLSRAFVCIPQSDAAIPLPGLRVDSTKRCGNPSPGPSCRFLKAIRMVIRNRDRGKG